MASFTALALFAIMVIANVSSGVDASGLPAHVQKFAENLQDQSREQLLKLIRDKEDEFEVSIKNGQLAFHRKMDVFQIRSVSGQVTDGFKAMENAAKSQFGRLRAKAIVESARARWENKNKIVIHQAYKPGQCGTLPFENPANILGHYKFSCDLEKKKILVSLFEPGCVGEARETKIWKDGDVTAVCAEDGSYVELEYETTDNLLNDELARKPHSSYWECDCVDHHNIELDSLDPILEKCRLVTVTTETYEKIAKKQIVADGGDALCNIKGRGRPKTEAELAHEIEESKSMEQEQVGAERRNLISDQCQRAEDRWWCYGYTNPPNSNANHDIQLCREACLQDGGCRGISFRYGDCDLWRRDCTPRDRPNASPGWGYELETRSCFESGNTITSKMEWTFGTCDYNAMVGKSNQLVSQVGSVIGDVVNMFSNVACVAVGVYQEACSFVEDEVCQHSFLSWICDTVVQAVCQQELVGKIFNCGGGDSYFENIGNTLKSGIEEIYNTAAGECGATVNNGRRRRLQGLVGGHGDLGTNSNSGNQASSDKVDVVEILDKYESVFYPDGQLHNKVCLDSLPSCPPATHAGSGWEIGASLTLLGITVQTGIGQIQTQDGYQVMYGFSSGGVETELAAYGGWFGFHVSVPTLSDFLGKGWELGASGTIPFLEVGVGASLTWAKNGNFAATTIFPINAGSGIVPGGLEANYVETICFTPATCLA